MRAAELGDGLVTLRAATPADADMILDWRNDPWIVSLSTHGRTVERDEHYRWYEKALSSARCLLFVVVVAGHGDVGVVRLDAVEDYAWLTIYIVQGYTRRGYGVSAMRLACSAAAEAWSWLRSVHARVREDNIASRKAFARAGFRLCEAARHRGCEPGTVEFVYEVGGPPE